jgi:hypothetical protein
MDQFTNQIISRGYGKCLLHAVVMFNKFVNLSTGIEALRTDLYDVYSKNGDSMAIYNSLRDEMKNFQPKNAFLKCLLNDSKIKVYEAETDKPEFDYFTGDSNIASKEFYIVGRDLCYGTINFPKFDNGEWLVKKFANSKILAELRISSNNPRHAFLYLNEKNIEIQTYPKSSRFDYVRMYFLQKK